jgi:two-component system, sensor histidine kinase
LRLQQILWNLISNAIKFTDKGSIAITIKQTAKTSGGVQLEFSVKDTGIGIQAEKISVIFDPFVQVNSSRSRRHHGTGLGLAITKKLIDLMGGTIIVKSEVNKGSNFKFELEFQDAKQTISEPENNKLTVPANLSILLVEDEPVSQAIVEALLTDEGYQVKVASSGFEALKKIDEQPFDIILMDLRMPEMDGLEATSQIRSMSDKKIASTKIIAFTGDVMKETVQQCEAIGMDGVIAKPIDIHEVNRVIANVFNNVA